MVGKIHDKTLLDNFDLESPEAIQLYLDLGFIGYKVEDKVKVILPHKKPRNTKTEKRILSPKQKEENKRQSSIRVKIENIFGQVKTMRILKDTLKNYKKGFGDLVMITAASLYNFRNGFVIN